MAFVNCAQLTVPRMVAEGGCPTLSRLAPIVSQARRPAHSTLAAPRPLRIDWRLLTRAGAALIWSKERPPEMDFRNSTNLDDTRFYKLFLRHTVPYRHDKLTVRVRYSRGADFSGSCHYRTARLLINLGRHNRYPYALATHVARAESNRTHWWRELYRLTLADGYQLAL